MKKLKKCRFIIRETGWPCQEDATYTVRDLRGVPIGKCCPKHGKETERLIQGANAFIGATRVADN